MPYAAFLLLAFLSPPQGLGPAVEYPANGHRYRVSDVEVTLEDAHELARLAGGTLLALEDAEEEAWVRATFGAERIWLGLEYPRERWVSGAEVRHVHWDEGEPNGHDREAFTVMGWKRDSGAWNDISAESLDRFRALIELRPAEPGVALKTAVLKRPELRGARGAWIFVVEGLTQADLEDEHNPGLHRLWREGAWAAADADPGGDALASWGLLTQGVGQTKSDLVAGGKPPRHVWFPTLLERLEELSPGITTSWILDDPELSRLIASGGRADVRVLQRGPQREEAVRKVLDGQVPLCAVIGHTLLRAKPAERARALRLVDVELGVLWESLAQRPERVAENWLVVLAGTPPLEGGAKEAGAKERKKDGAISVARAPLVLLGQDFPAGPWRGTIGLADVLPTVAEHFGLRPGLSWALDGRALRVQRAELGRNLLENGGGEAQRCWRREPGPVPGWTTDGAVQVSVYSKEELPSDVPGPAARGANHFRGSRSPRAQMEQLVDVSALAEAIDAKTLRAELSGWLGGGLDNGAAELELALLDANGKELERALLGPVGSAERRKELGAEKGVVRAGLVARSLTLELAKGTRMLRVRLRFEGPKRSDIACADELELVLRAR